MRLDRLEVIGLAQYSEQNGICDEVKAREGTTLVVEIGDERTKADLQLHVNVPQHHGFGHLLAVAALQYSISVCCLMLFTWYINYTNSLRTHVHDFVLHVHVHTYNLY